MALLLVTLIAYQPAWHGGILWDDSDHLTSVPLQSLHGLWRIWFDVGATEQYYPIVHSMLWMFHQIWGDDTFAYHLLNICLHASSAFLVAVILRRLAVPGAALAAVIFALHPVHVESVAWMTELKNTLSGVFYLLAALVYLRFDATRERRSYALALALFVAALLSKTVTSTLPAALLVVLWWQRGRLSWRRDVRPLAPFFALGLAAGAFTAWFERTYDGAQGAAFQFTVVERCLIAGRAICFYVGKLLWPTNLTFIYPKWQISQDAWWQYLFPLAVVAIFAGLWLWRTRSRAPLATMLFFCGTLVPALGFANVYAFRFSFVADHFQYLASIGVIAPVSAGLIVAARRWRISEQRATLTAMIVLGAPLAVLTWQQSHEYVDAETLYRATLANNPSCAMCNNNLGEMRLHGTAAQLSEAEVFFKEALRLDPASGEARANLAVTFQRMGRLVEAEALYRDALTLAPDSPKVHISLGEVLLESGRVDAAIAEISAALKVAPDYAEAHMTMGNALQHAGRTGEAVDQYNEALRLNPDYADAHTNLGAALVPLGRLDEALTQFQAAARLAPDSAAAHHNLGLLFLRMGRRDEALAELKDAARAHPDASLLVTIGKLAASMNRPDDAVAAYSGALQYVSDAGAAEIHDNLGVVLAQQGRLSEAVTHFTAALRIRPDFPEARSNLARAQAAGGR